MGDYRLAMEARQVDDLPAATPAGSGRRCAYDGRQNIIDVSRHCALQQTRLKLQPNSNTPAFRQKHAAEAQRHAHSLAIYGVFCFSPWIEFNWRGRFHG